MLFRSLQFLGWATEKLKLKSRCILFRFTTSHVDNVAREVQGLLASLHVSVLRFRTSLAGANSVVEFEAEVSHSQEMQITNQLNREGVLMELLPTSGHHE